MNWLLILAIIILAGMLIGSLVGKIRLPRVTGYLIAGILIGPFVLKIIPSEAIDSLSVISEAALGFIAYSIGSSLNFKHLKKVGIGVIIISLCEALVAALVVMLVMIFVFKQPVAFAISIGAIASATAPAATIMVIKQYKAHGPLVDTLIPVVAIDDGIAIIDFGVSLAIAKVLVDSSATFSIMSVVKPIIEIFGALALGAAIGLVLVYINRFSKSKEQTMSLAIGTILLTAGITKMLDISSLLTCMSIGSVVSNVTNGKTELLSSVDGFTNPIYIAFFTISGLGLDFSVLKTVGVIGVGYMVARVAGKVIGGYVGCKIAKSEPVVQKYFGFTLVPQAGVAIGLTLLVGEALPAYGAQIRAIVLAATVVYELIGPLCTKFALFRAGEAHAEA